MEDFEGKYLESSSLLWLILIVTGNFYYELIYISYCIFEQILN